MLQHFDNRWVNLIISLFNYFEPGCPREGSKYPDRSCFPAALTEVQWACVRNIREDVAEFGRLGKAVNAKLGRGLTRARSLLSDIIAAGN